MPKLNKEVSEMATVNLRVLAEDDDLKRFFNRTSAISEEFESLTGSKSFKRLVFTEVTKYFGRDTKWPKYGMTKDEFENEVKAEIRAIATTKGLEFFLKDGSLVAIKPVIAASVNENTVKQAVMNVCQTRKECI
jgi:hypothetical protein